MRGNNGLMNHQGLLTNIEKIGSLTKKAFINDTFKVDSMPSFLPQARSFKSVR